MRPELIFLRHRLTKPGVTRLTAKAHQWVLVVTSWKALREHIWMVYLVG
jgi:hypothetical protein